MTQHMTPEMTQQLRIRQLVENWAVWRDAGLWDKFRTVWHDDGVMMATWFQGPFEEFIKVTIEGWNKGVSILHFLGGSAIEVKGDRVREGAWQQRGSCHATQQPKGQPFDPAPWPGPSRCQHVEIRARGVGDAQSGSTLRRPA